MKPRMIEGEVKGPELLRVLEANDSGKNPIGGGKHTIVRNVTLSTTPKQVPHGLKSQPQGWLAIRIRGVGGDYPAEPLNTPPTKTHITLVTASAMVADIMVW